MLDLEACERRVYRLAMLLTGSPAVATRVIASVLSGRADLRELDGPHLDRLTLLRAREFNASEVGGDRGRFLPDDTIVPRRFTAALAGLPGQAREIWIFRHVYRFAVRDAARAMDCSHTAAARHLELAEASMQESLGDESDDAAESFLRYSLALDVPELYLRRKRRLRRHRWLRYFVFLLLFLAAAGALIVWWQLLA